MNDDNNEIVKQIKLSEKSLEHFIGNSWCAPTAIFTFLFIEASIIFYLWKSPFIIYLLSSLHDTEEQAIVLVIISVFVLMVGLIPARMLDEFWTTKLKNQFLEQNQQYVKLLKRTDICMHRGEKGLYCSVCGRVIKERCPNCRELESLEATKCETRSALLASAESAVYINYNNISDKFISISALATALVVMTIIMILGVVYHFRHTGIFALLFFLIGLIGPGIYLGLREDFYKKSFLKKNPQYADIFEKAKDSKWIKRPVN